LAEETLCSLLHIHKTKMICRLTEGESLFCGAWLKQRVAMDDLASYFVEERSKVR